MTMHEPFERQNVIDKYLQGLYHHEDGYLKSDDELFERSLAAVNDLTKSPKCKGISIASFFLFEFERLPFGITSIDKNVTSSSCINTLIHEVQGSVERSSYPLL